MKLVPHIRARYHVASANNDALLINVLGDNLYTAARRVDGWDVALDVPVVLAISDQISRQLDGKFHRRPTVWTLYRRATQLQSMYQMCYALQYVLRWLTHALERVHVHFRELINGAEHASLKTGHAMDLYEASSRLMTHAHRWTVMAFSVAPDCERYNDAPVCEPHHTAYCYMSSLVSLMDAISIAQRVNRDAVPISVAALKTLLRGANHESSLLRECVAVIGERLRLLFSHMGNQQTFPRQIRLMAVWVRCATLLFDTNLIDVVDPERTLINMMQTVQWEILEHVRRAFIALARDYGEMASRWRLSWLVLTTDIAHSMFAHEGDVTRLSQVLEKYIVPFTSGVILDIQRHAIAIAAGVPAPDNWLMEPLHQSQIAPAVAQGAPFVFAVLKRWMQTMWRHSVHSVALRQTYDVLVAYVLRDLYMRPDLFPRELVGTEPLRLLQYLHKPSRIVDTVWHYMRPEAIYRAITEDHLFAELSNTEMRKYVMKLALTDVRTQITYRDILSGFMNTNAGVRYRAGFARELFDVLPNRQHDGMVAREHVLSVLARALNRGAAPQVIVLYSNIVADITEALGLDLTRDWTHAENRDYRDAIQKVLDTVTSLNIKENYRQRPYEIHTDPMLLDSAEIQWARQQQQQQPMTMRPTPVTPRARTLPTGGALEPPAAAPLADRARPPAARRHIDIASAAAAAAAARGGGGH
jgi:hypothetical protein